MQVTAKDQGAFLSFTTGTNIGFALGAIYFYNFESQMSMIVVQPVNFLLSFYEARSSDSHRCSNATFCSES